MAVISISWAMNSVIPNGLISHGKVTVGVNKDARRQWSLLSITKNYVSISSVILIRKCSSSLKAKSISENHKLWKYGTTDEDQILAFMRKDLLFIYNFNPTKSFEGYGFQVPEGRYNVVLNTDAREFGGYSLADDSVEHITLFDKELHEYGKGWMKIYIPARSAVVLRHSETK